jgi:L-cysteine S-thiosulfotransferase
MIVYPGKFRCAAALAVLVSAAGALAAPSAEDIAAGKALAGDRNSGNCFACHQVEGAELAGNIGPPLVAMKMRFPERQVLYDQVADPRLRNPNTVMPPYGAHGILSERELNLVIDYLLTL